MKKSTIGVIVFIFGLCGIIGGAQDSTLKGRSGFFIASAVACVAGLLLFLFGRKRSQEKTATVEPDSTGGVVTKIKLSPSKPSFVVSTDRKESYVIPSRCCACLGPAERTVGISCRESLGNRTLTLEFPICRACYKERYRISRLTLIEPVAMLFRRHPIKTYEMEFKFCNRDYAESFAAANKGEFVKTDIAS
jgi:hypothetical protein